MAHDQRCQGADAALENVKTFVEQGKWGIIGVYDAEPSFFYTIGLHDLGLPELILNGDFRPELAMACLNAAGQYMIDKELSLFQEHTLIDDLMNLPVAFGGVTDGSKQNYMYQAIRFHGTADFKAQQLIWSDRSGKFPWDVDSEFVMKYGKGMYQKLLGE
jgi:hypothetical protein